MNEVLPPEIAVTELPDGVRYQLPTRKPGRYTSRGAMAIFCGLVGGAFVSLWLWGLWREQADRFGMHFHMMLFGAGMLLTTLGMIVYGFAILIGHSEIELRGGTLSGFECWGGFRWPWRRSVTGLCRFEVRDTMTDKDAGLVYSETAAATDFNMITPVWGAKDEPKHLAHGYPRAWLVPLANELARRVPARGSGGATGRHAGACGRGRGSTVAQQRRLRGTGRATGRQWFPGRGDRRGSTFHGPRGHTRLRRRATERVRRPAANKGAAWQSATRSRSWTRRQLAEIRVGRIVDPEGPDQYELHINPHPGEGNRFRLKGSEAETRWLATTLRKALRLPDTVEFLEREEQPAGSSIVLARSPRGIALEIPATGVGHPMVVTRLVGGVVLTVLAGVVAGLVIEEPKADFIQAFGLMTIAIFVFGFGTWGIALLVDGINRACRRLLVGVTDEAVILRQTNLLGTKQQVWQRPRVADIRVGSTAEAAFSNPALRQRAYDSQDPTWELQIHMNTGEIVRLLDGYGDAELQWAATMLRRELRSPTPTEADHKEVSGGVHPHRGKTAGMNPAAHQNHLLVAESHPDRADSGSSSGLAPCGRVMRHRNASTKTCGTALGTCVSITGRYRVPDGEPPDGT